ncbi:hypothetical protein E4T47_09097 [Aureobasidium subglaciale]|nr:hypothetical protein E4T47_09097 [Aureobasidium subglaciale]
MDFELKLTPPKARGSWIEGLIMGISYLFGGVLPMIPYFAFKTTNHALFTSIGITVVILLAFGYGKLKAMGNTGRDSLVSAIHTLIVGVIAAGTSYGIVRGINSVHIGGGTR